MTKVHASRQSARKKPALVSVAVLVAPFENDVLAALVAEAHEELSKASPARGLLGRRDSTVVMTTTVGPSFSEQPERLTTPSGLFVGHVKPALAR